MWYAEPPLPLVPHTRLPTPDSRLPTTSPPPTLPELYKPVLEELATFGYEFKRRTVPA